MQKQISDWLLSPNQDYEAGIALLSACSAKRHLIRVLTLKGKTPRTMFQLRHELSRNFKTCKPTVASKPGKPQNPPPKTQNPPRKTPKFLQVPGEPTGDAYLDDLISRKNKFHQAAIALKHQALFLAQPHRGQAASDVMKLIAKRDLLWRQIDYYQKFKIKPPDVLSSTDPALLDLKKRRDNLRSSVSKLKKKIADVTKAKSKGRYEADLAAKILEINELDKLINF
jgi:hypothetical protein